MQEVVVFSSYQRTAYCASVLGCRTSFLALFQAILILLSFGCYLSQTNNFLGFQLVLKLSLFLILNVTNFILFELNILFKIEYNDQESRKQKKHQSLYYYYSLMFD